MDPVAVPSDAPPQKTAVLFMTVMTSAASGRAAIPWILVWSCISKDDRRSSTVTTALFDFVVVDVVDEDGSSDEEGVAEDVEVRKSP